MNGGNPYAALSGELLGQRQVVRPPAEPEFSIAQLFQSQRARTQQPDFASQEYTILHWAHYNFQYLYRKLTAASDEVRDAVTIDVGVMHGNPVFRGTRIPIYEIVEELADGTPLQEIQQGYPSLTVDLIQYGLDFAASLLRIYDEQIPD